MRSDFLGIINKIRSESCLDIWRLLIDICSHLGLWSIGEAHAVRPRPVISIAATVGLIEAIEAAGGNPDQIFHVCGVNRSVFSKLEGFLACSVFAEILKEAAKATGDDCFGLHFGER